MKAPAPGGYIVVEKNAAKSDSCNMYFRAGGGCHNVHGNTIDFRLADIRETSCERERKREKADCKNVPQRCALEKYKVPSKRGEERLKAKRRI